jgi:hypothetical protein
LSPKNGESEWCGRRSTAKQPLLPPTNLAAYTTNVCSYAWIVNKQTIYEPQHIADAIQSVFETASRLGSKSFTTMVLDLALLDLARRLPTRPFYWRFHNVAMETNSVTIFNVAGYRASNVDAMLEVTVRVINSKSKIILQSTKNCHFRYVLTKALPMPFVPHTSFHFRQVVVAPR